MTMTDHDQETGEIVPRPSDARGQPIAHVPPPVEFTPPNPFSGPHDKIDKAIAAVTREAAPIFKGGTNSFQNYKYSRIEDYTEVVADLIGKHELAIYETAIGRNEIAQMVYVDYHFYISCEGQTAGPFKVTGQARSRDSKGNFDPAALPKCLTSARKQFYTGRFHLKTTDDPDRDAPPMHRDNARTPVQQPAPQKRDPSQPVAIPHDDEAPWENWSREWLAAVTATTDPAHGEKWLEANRDTLEKLRGQMPDHHGFVMRKYQQHMLSLQRGKQ